MEINAYIERVVNTRKNIFCQVTINDGFDKTKLLKICDLRIPRERLIEAWDMIIDTLNDKSMYDFLPPEVIEFMITNNICLCGLGHLKLANHYLQRIYDKDNSCWEALKNMQMEEK